VGADIAIEMNALSPEVFGASLSGDIRMSERIEIANAIANGPTEGLYSTDAKECLAREFAANAHEGGKQCFQCGPGSARRKVVSIT
jgi:hypothetical protein